MSLRDFLRRMFRRSEGATAQPTTPLPGHPGRSLSSSEPAGAGPQAPAATDAGVPGSAGDSGAFGGSDAFGGSGSPADGTSTGNSSSGEAPAAEVPRETRPRAEAPVGVPRSLSWMTDGQLRDALRLRIVNVDSLPTLDGLPHLRALAPSIVEVLTIDLPTAVLTPPLEDVARLGPTSELVAQGRDNLHALVDDSLSGRRIIAEDGLNFTLIQGPDYSNSSLGLVLPAVLAHIAPDSDLGRGVAVSVPDRSHLVVRVIEGLESLMALGPMAAYSRNVHDEGDGMISPEVYWAQGPRLDDWEQLTRQTPEGIEIHIPPELAALIEE